MQTLFQSLFFSSFGFVLLQSILYTSLLWIFFILIESQIRSVQIKYYVAIAFQIFSFLVFLSLLIDKFSFRKENLSIQPLLITQTPIFQLKVWFFSFSSIIYFIILLKLLFAWLLNFNSIRKIRKCELNYVNIEWTSFAANYIQQVKVFFSDTIKSPFTIGFLKPIIFLPISCTTYLSNKQIETIILHELAHIKRNDFVVNLFLSFIELILCFNPFTKWLSNYISEQREICCDEFVLHQQYDKTIYAEALLQLAKQQYQHQNVFSLSMYAAANKMILKNRIQLIVGIPILKKLQINLIVIACICIVAILLLLAPQQQIKVEHNKTAILNSSFPLIQQKEIKNYVIKKKQIKKGTFIRPKFVPEEAIKISEANEWQYRTEKMLQQWKASEQVPEKINLLNDLLADVRDQLNNVAFQKIIQQNKTEANAAKLALQQKIFDKIINNKNLFFNEQNLTNNNLTEINVNYPLTMESSLSISDTFKFNLPAAAISIYTNENKETFIKVVKFNTSKFY
jgi:beta-lactamase regulating signal transducer with metallopeptidase domain